jgi:hypothetical protein
LSLLGLALVEAGKLAAVGRAVPSQLVNVAAAASMLGLGRAQAEARAVAALIERALAWRKGLSAAEVARMVGAGRLSSG